MFYVQHLLILRPGFVHSFKRLSALDRSFTATAVNCAQGAHCREGTGFVQQASNQHLQQHFVQQAAPTRLPNATSIAGSQQSCHLSAQKRPQPLNRSGDKMDYRSFIRALKFQNRTRPSADGLLCCRRRYQNSFWRPVLQWDSTEIWWRCWCFWLSFFRPPITCLPSDARQAKAKY